MSGRSDPPRSVEERLLEQPRRTAGVDSSGQPVRLGERDAAGHIVGYIDEQGLAWESLTERIVAVHGNRLMEALILPYDDPRRDQLTDEVLGDLPDELIAAVASAAGEALAIRTPAQGFDL
jgi:hypothetical protein